MIILKHGPAAHQRVGVNEGSVSSGSDTGSKGSVANDV